MVAPLCRPGSRVHRREPEDAIPALDLGLGEPGREEPGLERVRIHGQTGRPRTTGTEDPLSSDVHPPRARDLAGRRADVLPGHGWRSGPTRDVVILEGPLEIIHAEDAPEHAALHAAAAGFDTRVSKTEWIFARMTPRADPGVARGERARRSRRDARRRPALVRSDAGAGPPWRARGWSRIPQGPVPGPTAPSSSVHGDHAGAFAEAAQESRQVGALPREVQMRAVAREVQQVHRSAAEDLVRQRDVAVPRVPHVGPLHAGIVGPDRRQGNTDGVAASASGDYPRRPRSCTLRAVGATFGRGGRGCLCRITRR
jgi:hypothetical protein